MHELRRTAQVARLTLQGGVARGARGGGAFSTSFVGGGGAEPG